MIFVYNLAAYAMLYLLVYTFPSQDILLAVTFIVIIALKNLLTIAEFRLHYFNRPTRIFVGFTVLEIFILSTTMLILPYNQVLVAFAIHQGISCLGSFDFTKAWKKVDGLI